MIRAIVIFLAVALCHCGGQPQSGIPQETMDTVRKYVYDNTCRGTNPDMWDTGRMIEEIEAGNRPCLNCGPVSLVMVELLRRKGYGDYIQRVFVAPGGDVDLTRVTHTFIEALVDGEYQAHDALYDLYYLRPDGRRANASDLIYMKDEVIPCNSAGTCGPDAYAGYEGLKSHFDSVLVSHRLLYAPERFDPERAIRTGEQAADYLGRNFFGPTTRVTRCPTPESPGCVR